MGIRCNGMWTIRLENDQHILRNISELEGKTFWIGEKVYHVTLPWIEILGRYLDKI